MANGTIQDVINNGSIVTVVILDDEGTTHMGHGSARLTVNALEALFPEGVVKGESRVSFKMESWGGLAALGEEG